MTKNTSSSTQTTALDLFSPSQLVLLWATFLFTTLYMPVLFLVPRTIIHQILQRDILRAQLLIVIVVYRLQLLNRFILEKLMCQCKGDRVEHQLYQLQMA